MRSVLIAALGLLIAPQSAQALCKYRAQDGTWVYSQSCATMDNKEITQNANAVVRKNQLANERDDELERRRLRGYEYRETDHGGVPVKEVQPNPRPSPTWWEGARD